MLVLKIESRQLWDPNTEEFVYINETELRLEHSLLALAKWESKWHVPFFTASGELTMEQQLDYIRCMNLNDETDPGVYAMLTKKQLQAITEYMDDPMTATWFRGEPRPNEPRTGKVSLRKLRSRGTETTAEVIYCQMFQFGVPKECEQWHLNRLMTLLRVCSESQMPPKKMSPGEATAQRQALNAKRKAKLRTRG